MSVKPWEGVVPPETLEHYRRAGFGAPSARGRSPALLVVDVQYHATGEAPMPLADALAYHPMCCGEAAWQAIPNVARLVAAFRQHGLPIVYPTVAPRSDRGSRFGTMPSFAGTGARGYEIVAEVAPRPEDLLLPKGFPSAFFATALASRLNALRVDTLVLTGCTTSGCIRATAVDAYAFNYKVIVAHDAVFDRSPVSHAVNLFDLAHKYAEVLSTGEALGAVGEMAAAS